MDLQKLINNMNEQSAREKSNYHLTYGGLIEALKKAPKDATFDKRVKGIGSYRGSYIEVALYTDEEGYHAEKGEFNDYSGDNFWEKHKEWKKENVIESNSIPRNANELGELLESLLGLYFVGYKGGHYKIEEYKPLWLNTDGSTGENVAIVGIDEKLKLITKEL